MLYDTSTFNALAAAHLDTSTPHTLLLSASQRVAQRPFDVTAARLLATVCAKLGIKNDD